MTKDEIVMYLQESFKQIAPEIVFSQIQLDRPLRDQVEIDSLDLYNIITLLQKKTGVFISDSQLAVMPNLNELINFILKSLK